MRGTEQLTIRPAVDDDADAIAGILNAAIAGRAATAALDPVTPGERRARLRKHGERYPFWVAADDAGVAGWFALAPWSERVAYDLTAEVSVYVAPGRQGRGVGAKLVRHAIAEAPRLGIEVYVARVFAHNPVSLRLFERSTFSAGGRCAASRA
jgi:L-amino acid N-acyltransferase YncA